MQGQKQETGTGRLGKVADPSDVLEEDDEEGRGKRTRGVEEKEKRGTSPEAKWMRGRDVRGSGISPRDCKRNNRRCYSDVSPWRM